MTANSERPVYLTTSRPIVEIPSLETFLQARVFKSSALLPLARVPADAVLAWGRKPSAAKAERLAAKRKLPLIRLEDGFFRSLSIGAESPPCALVIDDLGIYYDAERPSRLEQLALTKYNTAQLARASALRRLICEERVSKYNHAPERLDTELPARYVLLVDQTHGDASIRCGLASEASYKNMLSEASELYPDCHLIVKTHPDVVAGIKQGCFADVPADLASRVIWVNDNVHPPTLLEQAVAVFCVTSQMGFEALLWGKTVHCYGMPFYAGWGLTIDKLKRPARRRDIALDALVHAALIDYSRYVLPERPFQQVEVEAVIAWLGEQRRKMIELPQRLYALPFPRWKRAHVKRFLGRTALCTVRDWKYLPKGEPVLVWGAQTFVPAHAGTAFRLEDGFVRSVGLGADLVAPTSWVIDDLGMYYDAQSPSRLEWLLQNGNILARDVAKAVDVRRRLVEQKLSKYNVGQREWRRPNISRRVILVPGQVESDASIKLGSPVIRTNRDLLLKVREMNPEAFIVYKPHPDVVAGLRLQGEADAAPSMFCDAVVLNVDMAVLLEHVDEVHTLTSLTGFEALLRELPVTCYGQPFYSGWGLTHDVYPCERRGRVRTLDELVAAALIMYPRYVSQVSQQLTTIDTALDELSGQREQHGGVNVAVWRRIGRLLQWFKRF